MVSRLPLLACVLLVTVISYQAAHGTKNYADKLLFISMDGFRWDYMDMVDTPNMDRFAREGVRAPKGLINPMITKTFPCHYTLATGLYEESHGIVSNHMYDPVFNETFSFGTTDTKWWDGGEPIWITAKLQGLKSATYFWPGSEAELKGVRPDIWLPYAQKTPFKPRVDSVVDWFKVLDIDFSTLYFHEPDLTGHIFGPNSPEIREKVKEMDSLVGHMFEKLTEAGLLDKMNIILTSDHGMTEVNTTTMTIDLLDYVHGDLFYVVDSGPIANIRPSPGKTQDVYDRLKDAHPNMTVYLKADIPEFYHYKHNRRVMDIFAVADEGWTITRNRSKLRVEHGNHGYNNRLQSMHPFFLARGPNFRRHYQVEPFETVNLYPLMCELLGLQPAPNNGTFNNVKGMVITSNAPSLMSGKWLFLLPIIHLLANKVINKYVCIGALSWRSRKAVCFSILVVQERIPRSR